MADAIVLMRKGRIVQTGTALDLYRRPVDLDAARFFSDLNEVAGIARGGRLETPIGAFPAPHLAEGEPGVAAVRPQAVVPSLDGPGLAGRIVTSRFLGEVDLL